ncbi:MAG TPA: hypothetical protein VG602_08235 [Actinomycetota bacterium]|nr:hypothetical protein [Actinomycetota bacterium]
MGVVAQIDIEGALVVVSAMVLFPGSVWLLLSAVFGVRMGYLVAATGFFGFMVILSALWAFGAPGTPPFLGPKGDLPTWKPLAEGVTLTSNVEAVEQYPGGPWKAPEDDPALSAEVEPATLTFQEFLAEEAAGELRQAGIQGEITPETFEITGLRFATVDGTKLAAATAFAEAGGPEVTVVGWKDPGNESMPSYLFLVGSVIGFAAHLPFLDRAEKRRKDILTGGDQAPWRGPA